MPGARPEATATKTETPASPVRELTEDEKKVFGEAKPEDVEAYLKAPEKVQKEVLRAKKKALIVTTLDRGILNSRLYVELPEHLHGEWVKNDHLEINRLKAIGFEVDTKYAPKQSLHNDGSDSAVVGDVIHMIAPKEVKELVDEAYAEKTNRMMGGRKRSQEDTDYEEQVKRLLEPHGIKAISESRQESVGATDISEALAAATKQTTQNRG